MNVDEQQTRYWQVDARQSVTALLTCDAIQEAAVLLKEGKTVAFPTETVYGLGADVGSDAAVAQIFAAKGRPSDNPLIAHIANYGQWAELVDDGKVSDLALQLAHKFWPGPLTLVVPARSAAVSTKVTAGLDTVAIRMPQHPVALALITAAGVPLAAPSANRSGRPSPTCAAHVSDDLHGRIGGIVDGGASDVGVESTVVEVQDHKVIVLRPGGVSIEQLKALDLDVCLDPALVKKDAEMNKERYVPRAPGMKYTHYAPQGELLLVTGDDRHLVHECMRQELLGAKRKRLRTGVLTFDEHLPFFSSVADHVASFGSQQHPEQAAQRLYAALRSCDTAHVDWIVVEGLGEEEQGLSAAVMNRLHKAADRIIHV